MSDKERDKYLDDLKKYLERETSSKEESSKFLKRLGVHTKTGRITKKYSKV